MGINHVLLVGHVTDAGPKLGYPERGSPECRMVGLWPPRSPQAEAVPCAAF